MPEPIFRLQAIGIDIGVGIFSLDVYRYRTMCCALGQLSLNNFHTKEEIQGFIDFMKAESEIPVNGGMRKGGERAVFVITTPDEEVLAKNLEELGFSMIAEFHRRNCFSENDMLKMWLISW